MLTTSSASDKHGEVKTTSILGKAYTQSLFVSYIGSMSHYDSCLRSIAGDRHLVTSGMHASRIRALLPIAQLDALPVLAPLRHNAPGARFDLRLFSSIASRITAAGCAGAPHGDAQEACFRSLHE